MNHTDQSCEQLLKALRQLEISKKNPEQLNCKILDGITTLPQCPPNTLNPLIKSVIPGIAAILVIGFFTYELLKISSYSTATTSPTPLFSIEIPSQATYSMQDKIKLYSDQLQYRQGKGKKREQLQAIFQKLNLKNQMP